MELGEFISGTIQQVEGALEDTNFVLGTGSDKLQRDSENGVIEFDILVTVSAGDVTKGGGTIQVVSLFTGGLNKEVNSETNHSSRIKFQIKRAFTKQTSFTSGSPSSYRPSR